MPYHYKTNVDIMFGDRFFATIKNVIIDNMFGPKHMIEDIIKQVEDVRPSLRERPDYWVYYKTKDGEDTKFQVVRK